VDILLPSHNIAIEVMGKMHRVAQKQSYNGQYQMKKRVLERLGYRVFEIEVMDYYQYGETVVRQLLGRMSSHLKQ